MSDFESVEGSVSTVVARKPEREGLPAGYRMRALETHASDWGTSSCDRPALVAAIGGAIFVTMALAGEGEGQQFRVTVVAAEGEVQQVDVSQDEVTVSGQVVERLFDPTWTDRPGGWFTDVAAATFRAVAERFGGHARFLTGDRRGTTLRMIFGRG